MAIVLSAARQIRDGSRVHQVHPAVVDQCSSCQLSPLIDGFEPATGLDEPSRPFEAGEEHRCFTDRCSGEQHDGVNRAWRLATGGIYVGVNAGERCARIESSTSGSAMIEAESHKDISGLSGRDRPVGQSNCSFLPMPHNAPIRARPSHQWIGRRLRAP